MSVEDQKLPQLFTKEVPGCGRLLCDPSIECTADNMLDDMKRVTGSPIPDEYVKILTEGCKRREGK